MRKPIETLASGLGHPEGPDVLPDGRIGCLYERGATSPYDEIALARFGLDWVTAGKK